MGAWGHGVFDDDTAYDALDDLRASSDIVTDMEKYFDAVIGAEYVEYDEGIYALVSAAVIDSVISETGYRCDDETYCKWIGTLKGVDLVPLREKAIAAIDAVISDDSELKGLWEENEELYHLWREDKLTIQKRIRNFQSGKCEG